MKRLSILALVVALSATICFATTVEEVYTKINTTEMQGKSLKVSATGSSEAVAFLTAAARLGDAIKLHAITQLDDPTFKKIAAEGDFYVEEEIVTSQNGEIWTAVASISLDPEQVRYIAYELFLNGQNPNNRLARGYKMIKELAAR